MMDRKFMEELMTFIPSAHQFVSQGHIRLKHVAVAWSSRRWSIERFYHIPMSSRLEPLSSRARVIHKGAVWSSTHGLKEPPASEVVSILTYGTVKLITKLHQALGRTSKVRTKSMESPSECMNPHRHEGALVLF